MPLTIEFAMRSGGSDPTDDKYKGGETVRGNVVVINNSGKGKMLNQGLMITFIGRGNTSWKEQRRHQNHMRQYLITVFDEDIYFHDSIPLHNADCMIPDKEIPPGRTEYPFICQLPMGLPESYQGTYGSVSYSAEVLYNRSWKPDKLVRNEFEVSGYLDLNSSSMESLQPGYFTMDKQFWFGLGNVSAKLYLPRRGYTTGEFVNFSLQVSNNSPWYLKKIRVYFCQVTTFFAKTSSRREGARLCKIKCKPVYPKETADIEGSILIPEVPPTELGGCRLIQPQYGIMVKAVAATLGKLLKSSVLEGRVPILIGTVPLGHISSARDDSEMVQTRSMICTSTSEDGPVYDHHRMTTASPSSSSSTSTSCRPNSSNFTNICRFNSTDQELPPTYEDATLLNLNLSN